MTLTPLERQKLKADLLSSVETSRHESIDEKFIRPIFGSHTSMLFWASVWGISISTYSVTGVNRKVGQETLPIKWVQFSLPEKDDWLLIEGEDEGL